MFVERSWRYWRQQRLERELRELYSNDLKRIRAEILERMRKQMEHPEIKHFKALDRVRVKEIDELKLAAQWERGRLQTEIARLEGLLRDRGIQYWENTVAGNQT